MSLLLGESLLQCLLKVNFNMQGHWLSSSFQIYLKTIFLHKVNFKKLECFAGFFKLPRAVKTLINNYEVLRQ